MAYYWPQAEGRQAALDPAAAALLFIDVQNYNCSRQGAIYRSLAPKQQQVPRARAAGSRPACTVVGGLALPTAGRASWASVDLAMSQSRHQLS